MDAKDQRLYKIFNAGNGRWDVYEDGRRIANGIYWTEELGIAILYDYTGTRYGGSNKYVFAFIKMYDDLKSRISNVEEQAICGLTIREIMNGRKRSKDI